MSVLASLVVVASCSWDNPGANPYRGPVAQSVHNYKDIPLEARNRLQKRMDAKKYDEVARIERDRIVGEHEYTELRDMHFGNGRMCKTVTRSKWKPNAIERGLVYCEDEHCLIVPTVCNNVSRVTRIPKPDPKPGPPPTPKSGELPPTSPVPPITGGGSTTPLDIPPVNYGGSTIPLNPLTPYSETPFWPPYVPPSPPIIYYVPTPAIPEPSTWLLALIGLAMIAFKARK